VGSQARWRGDGFQALALAGLTLLFYLVTPRIPASHISIITLTSLIALALVLTFTVRVARALRTPRAILANLGLSGALILPSVLLPILIQASPQWSGWMALRPFFRLYAMALFTLPGLNGLLLIWFAASLGAGLARVVREMKLLLPMAVALALVDLYVVFGGGLVTQAQSGKAPVAAQAMEALTVKLPTATPKTGAAPIPPQAGFADFLFIALFFACFARFGVSSRRTFLVLCATLCLYMAVVIVAPQNLALPALVPIAAVVIGMHWRQFRYERSELFALLYAGLIVAAILGALAFFSLRGGSGATVPLP
jgi:hypothetical protein